MEEYIEQEYGIDSDNGKKMTLWPDEWPLAHPGQVSRRNGQLCMWHSLWCDPCKERKGA